MIRFEILIPAMLPIFAVMAFINMPMTDGAPPVGHAIPQEAPKSPPMSRAPMAHPVESLDHLKGLRADFILVDKSDRVLIVYQKGKEILRLHDLQLGDTPTGHKRFQGDEKTPEGDYTIDLRNPQSRYHLSLRISYPNKNDRTYAHDKGKPPGGDIYIHGQPKGVGPREAIAGDWTDGCIAVSNFQVEQLWKIVPDGTPIRIVP